MATTDAAPAGLETFKPHMSGEEKALADMLLTNDQAHVFAGWSDGDADAAAKHAFFEQVKGLEAGYPGGVAAYVSNGRKLLADSAAGVNPFEGYHPEVPEGVRCEYATPEFHDYEATGLKTFNRTACVLVAGGLGERLGYGGIKLALPTEISTATTYLALYCKQILALQAASNKLNGTSAVVPLAIMTSGDTHDRTVELLAANDNFGMAEGQVVLMKQEKVAALGDSSAHIAMKDAYTIDTKPHGHGDVHTLLHSTGLAAKWKDEGRQYILFFQDTNGLCFTTAVASLGISVKENLQVNSVCVPRKAKEAVGAIARLKHVDGSSLTCNVEYNQLEPLLLATLGTGDENDSTGFSPFPGNINQLWVEIEEFSNVLARTAGLVPEFVNPKYTDSTKTTFTKPTRLECMMQDLPKQLSPSGKHGFSQFPFWTYSPVKNSLNEAAKKAAAGVAPRCASQGELEFYEAECRRLRAVGVDVAAPKPWAISGFELPHGPHVVLDPALGVTVDEIRPAFPSPADVHIEEGATLIVNGGDVVIRKLRLKGTLVVNAAPGAKVVINDLDVDNAGWELAPLAEGADVPESLLIRGYSLVKHDAKVLDFPAAGDFTVGADGK